MLLRCVVAHHHLIVGLAVWSSDGPPVVLGNLAKTLLHLFHPAKVYADVASVHWPVPRRVPDFCVRVR
jgi:hypothetical protein